MASILDRFVLGCCLLFVGLVFTTGCSSNQGEPDPCVLDADCGDGEICADGLCRPGCVSNADCATGNCVDGACQSECQNNDDCAAQEKCEQNRCVPDVVVTDEDIDGDGLLNEIEDKNGNGLVDEGETDPENADSDGDGLLDGIEDANQDGQRDEGETDPIEADSDHDGLSDGIEDANHNGSRDDGETDALKADSDGDGLTDGQEDRNQNGAQDADETDPLTADSDADGLSDGQEDCNDNQMYDPGSETDPLAADTDGDGIVDGDEDRNGDCRLGTCLTPCADDNECGDGEVCSTTIGVCVSADCSSGETSPLTPDTDGDGLADNEEGTGKVCSSENLKPIDLHLDFDADTLLALETFFSSYADLSAGPDPAGAVFWSANHQVAGFLVTHPASAWVINATSQEAADRQVVSNMATVLNPSTRSLTTFDNFAAVVGAYSLEVSSRTPTELAGQLADALHRGGGLTGMLGPQGTAADSFRFFFETVYRSADRVVTVGVVASEGSFNDDQIIRMNDVSNSTALSAAADGTVVHCDSFTAVPRHLVDFIWVVDNSGSMTEEQDAIEAAGDAMEAQLANTTLDWRIGIVTTSGWDDGALVGGNFTRDITVFKDRIRLGDDGWGDEYGLQQGLDAIDRASPCDPDPDNPAASKLRCDASVVVVVLSDEDDQTIEDYSGGDNYAGAPHAQTVANMIQDFLERKATMFAIVGGDPPCPGAENHSRGYNAVVAGIDGSASLSICAPDQSDNMEQVVRAASGAASSYQLKYSPISATLKVAMERTAGQAPELVPRSRSDGFDYDGARNALIFYGSWRPGEAAREITASYRSFDLCISQSEICDGVDNDCNGIVDDVDGEEICDHVDNDCDGLVDEGFDADGDGWTSCGGDCDDTNADVNPGADEVCDGIDNDCDGETDPEWLCG